MVVMALAALAIGVPPKDDAGMAFVSRFNRARDSDAQFTTVALVWLI
jgi:hypothetical protein